MSPAQLEAAIARAAADFANVSATKEQRLEAFERMRQLIKQRTPHTVAMLERAKGIRHE